MYRYHEPTQFGRYALVKVVDVKCYTIRSIEQRCLEMAKRRQQRVGHSAICGRAQVHVKTLRGWKTGILHQACSMNENNDLVHVHVPLPQMPPGLIPEVHWHK